MRWVWNEHLNRANGLTRKYVIWETEVLKAAASHDGAFRPGDLGLASLCNAVDAVQRLWEKGDLDRDHASGRYRLTGQGRARVDRGPINHERRG